MLIANDTREIRLIATHLLHKAGYGVTVAENGRLAVQKIEAPNFDLVWMEVPMPEMNGKEAVVAILVRGIDVPIIAPTADATKGTRRRLMAAGFDEHLTKRAGRLETERIE